MATRRLNQQAVVLKDPTTAASRAVMLDNALDTNHGLVLEGTLDVPTARDGPVGLYLEYAASAGVAIIVRPGGVTELGPMRQDGSGFRPETRVDRQATFAGAVQFRLLLKGSLFEFYLNDHLVQCWRLPTSATGRIGLIRARPLPSATSKPGILAPDYRDELFEKPNVLPTGGYRPKWPKAAQNQEWFNSWAFRVTRCQVLWERTPCRSACSGTARSPFPEPGRKSVTQV